MFSVIILVTAIVFSLAEHVSLGNALYWAIVTAFTVGYGDISPHSVVGKLDGIVLMGTVTIFVLPLIVAHMITRMRTSAEQKKLEKDIAFIKDKVKLLED